MTMPLLHGVIMSTAYQLVPGSNNNNAAGPAFKLVGKPRS